MNYRLDYFIFFLKKFSNFWEATRDFKGFDSFPEKAGNEHGSFQRLGG